MTTADFIAGCFWPLMIVFALSLWKLRGTAAWRLVLTWASGTMFAYLALLLFYGPASIVVVIDLMIGGMLFGLALLVDGASRWTFARERKAMWRGIAFAVLGLGTTIFMAAMIVRDLVLPREIIEGRVENVYSNGRRATEYYVTIADRTVKAIIPDYERMKFKPMVRVEVGRGSHYIYRVEYLEN